MAARAAQTRLLQSLLLGVVSLAVLLVATEHHPGPINAAFPGGNGRIGFVSGSGDLDVYTMNPDGSNLVDITNTPALSEIDMAWSADGSKIAFTGGTNTALGIYTMNANGSNVVQLTTNSTSFEGYPTWSPDGTKIAFASGRPPASGIDIFVMNADGTGITRLTTSGGNKSRPAWSPDGARILYTTSGASTNGIFIMNANGTNPAPLAVGSGDAPDWSPDGSRIVYEAAADIYVMNADGSNQTNLTNSSAAEWDPAWSPDGTKIAFVSNPTGLQKVFTMNADGTGMIALTNGADVALSPHWQPFDSPPPTPTRTLTPSPTITPTVTATPQAVGGIVELPKLPAQSALEQHDTPPLLAALAAIVGGGVATVLAVCGVIAFRRSALSGHD